jgi:hypothetical protein
MLKKKVDQSQAQSLTHAISSTPEVEI